MWVLWALPAWAEDGVGSVRVTVWDAALELPVAGVRVQLGSIEALSDAGGEVLFTELAEGIYDASASRDGLRGVVLTGVPVHTHRVTPVWLCVEAGAGEPARSVYVRRLVDGPFGGNCGSECNPRECTRAEQDRAWAMMGLRRRTKDGR